MATFEEQVRAWGEFAEMQMLVVYQTATQALAEAMIVPKAVGGSMPVDTGFLRASLVASLSHMPTVDPKGYPKLGVTYGNPAIGAVLATMTVPGTIYFGFTAAYALRQNYGFVGADSLGRMYNQTGNFFVEKAGQRWPTFVAEAIRDTAATLATVAPP